jgi:hypothetical protein
MVGGWPNADCRVAGWLSVFAGKQAGVAGASRFEADGHRHGRHARTARSAGPLAGVPLSSGQKSSGPSPTARVGSALSLRHPRPPPPNEHRRDRPSRGGSVLHDLCRRLVSPFGCCSETRGCPRSSTRAWKAAYSRRTNAPGRSASARWLVIVPRPLGTGQIRRRTLFAPRLSSVPVESEANVRPSGLGTRSGGRLRRRATGLGRCPPVRGSLCPRLQRGTAAPWYRPHLGTCCGLGDPGRPPAALKLAEAESGA